MPAAWTYHDLALTMNTYPAQTPSGRRGDQGRILRLRGASRAGVVLLRQRRVERHAPSASARFVGQTREALREKPLHPFVHKAPADPNRGRNGGDRDSIGDE